MHPELEKLIEMVIADGQVTDKERAVLIKKAISLDVDPDEVEIYLDGKLHQLATASVEAQPAAKSKKEGDLKKCPSCGAPTHSFKPNCPECGHEFKNIEVLRSLKDFLIALKESSKENRQEVIKDFPIPNTKEDLLEFISISVSKAGFEGEDAVWTDKCNEALNKLEIMALSDTSLNSFIKTFKKKLRKKKSSKILEVTLYFVLFIFIIGLLIFIKQMGWLDMKK